MARLKTSSQFLMNSPPSFPPLYSVKRGKSHIIRPLQPPLCVAERGLGVSSWEKLKKPDDARPYYPILCDNVAGNVKSTNKIVYDLSGVRLKELKHIL
jgi:hypothetical protein